MSRIAVFPGSFDPITKGHADIVARAAGLFDHVVVAIGVNANKKYMFDLEQRLAWLNQTFEQYDNVSSASYEGLTVDFCKERGAKFILRGLRNGTDFDYECTIAQMNKSVSPDIESIFLMTSPEYMAINSSILRDLLRHGEDVSAFLPESINISS